MGRFVYLTDTHIGAEPPTYTQQPGYFDRLEDITAALTNWIADQGDIDFVLHGGDMIHRAEPEFIHAARKLFDLPVPVRLCLGNHDMLGDNALDLWLAEAPEFFIDGRCEYSLTCGPWAVDVLPCHWDDRPYSWTKLERPHFRPDQLARLDEAIAAEPDRPRVFITHSQALPVGTEQTGLDEPFHGPTEEFTRQILAVTADRPTIRCVLSGHTHCNSHAIVNGVHYAATSALVEAPFDIKRITTTDQSLSVETIALTERAGFPIRYDFDKTFIQGRPCDRRFDIQR